MNYVFFTGMGRSGTKFLTTLLGQIPNVHSVHEYIGNREFWLLSWYLHGTEFTIPFLERAKNKIETDYKQGTFIDVNGYLQNCAPELKAVFKPDKIFHVVRNPKAVVRSYYTRRNDADIHLLPKDRIQIEGWLDNDKFYQVCWNWANTTNQLLDQDTELVIFEKITTDYSYFKERILDPLNLDLSVEAWSAGVSTKVNKTRSTAYRWLYAKLKGKPFVEDPLPEYDNWPEFYKKQFAEICGPAMKRCGYSL